MAMQPGEFPRRGDLRAESPRFVILAEPGPRPMTMLDRPKLRPLHVQRLDHEGRAYVTLSDPLGIASNPVMVPLDGYLGIVRHFNGENSLDAICESLRRTGQPVAPIELEALITQLDRAMLLDGPTFGAYFDQYRREAVRPPSHAGRSYPDSESALRDRLDRYFTDDRGSGLPGRPADRNGSSTTLRAILSPHIDFHRGGPTYTWAYKELVEHSDADLFIILGVAHQYSQRRFVLTRKDFATPLGVARTDRAFVDRLAERAGSHFFDDELAHRTEHSIEFQVIFLQYLLAGRRDFAIVPILAGSFHDLLLDGRDPIDDPEVSRFVQALRDAEAASGRKVAYIGGIDLCHVGPEFGDPDRLSDPFLDEVRQFDAAMLGRASDGDPAGWFRTAAAMENRYRVCGLAATYTLLHAIGPSRGRLLHYDQAISPDRQCGVTFASLALESRGNAPPLESSP